MEQQGRTVYLFTETFPFPGPDDPFLPDEVALLADVFDIVLVPTLFVPGEPAPLAPGVKVCSDLREWSKLPRVRLASLIRAGLSPILYREVLRQRPLSLAPQALATMLIRLSRSLRVETWVRRRLPKDVGHDPALVYSWWSFPPAWGVARGLRGTGVPVVARAHGYDLFAEQERIGFVPFQRYLVEDADLIVTASNQGADYLRAEYPDLAMKVTTSYLGTADPGFLNEPSTDGVLRIVTCSSNTPVKRVDLLARSLSHLSVDSPGIDVHWTHIGSGPLSGDLDELISRLPGLARRSTLAGQLVPTAVKEWLRSNPVDLFVNVSSSEGLPVSLMEAASFGIPMMVTSVGGIPEIVSEANGILLEANPSPESIATALEAFARLTREERAAKRAASRATFERDFDAAVNYATFITLLKAMAA